MIIKQLDLGPDRQLCYLVGCEKTKEAAVIDPPGLADLIVAMARRAELNISYIFNTHHHADHTGGNRRLHELTGAKLLIHKSEVRPLLRKINLTKFWFAKFACSPAPGIIVDGDAEIKVGEILFKIYHTPGHTPGGLVFYAEGNLFTGDTLFVGDSGATNLPGGDRPALGASLRRLMALFPEDTVVWPGHDYGKTPTSTIGWEKRFNKNAKEYGFYTDTDDT
jgi:glyoxylase-like metal-dependent hydrolase (beta-lactamase superfamily II)